MSFTKRFLSWSLLVSSLLLAAGCGFFKADTISTEDVFKKIATKMGSFAEQYIPSDVVALAVLDFQEKAQQDAFDKLRRNFLSDEEWTEKKNELFVKLNENMPEDDFSFEKDILPVFGDAPRIAVAVDKKALEYMFGPKYIYSELETESDTVSPPIQPASSEAQVGSLLAQNSGLVDPAEAPGFSGLAQPGEESDFNVLGAPSYEQVPFEGEVLAIVKIESTEKFNALVDRFVKEEDWVPLDGEGMEIWQADNIFITRNQDMLVGSNSLEAVKSAVDRAKSQKDSIKDNANFKKVFEKLHYPHAGYLYIDNNAYTNALVNAMKADQPEMEPFMRSIYDTFMMGDVSGSSVVLEDKGVRSFSYSYLDESKLSDGDKGLEKFSSGKLTLLEKVPQEGVVVYNEMGGGLNIVAMAMINAMGVILNPGALEGEEEAEAFDIKAQLKAYTGLDIEKDILAFMDRNFAFYMSNTGSLVPAFSFMIDASSDPAAAEKTMKVLGSTITVGIIGLKASMTPQQAQYIVQEDVNINGKNVSRIAVDFSKISEQDKALLGLPEAMYNEKIEFYYGLTGDNVAIFALHAGLDKLYGKNSLAKSAAYKNMTAKLKNDDFNAGVVYLQPSLVMSYLDNLFATIKEMDPSEGLSEEEDEIYNMVKGYVSHVKGFVSGMNVTRSESMSETFLSIE